MKPYELTIEEASKKFSEKKLSSLELTESVLQRIKDRLAKSVDDQVELDSETVLANLLEVVPFDEISIKNIKSQIANIKNKDETKEFLNKVLEDVHRTREGQVGADMMRQIEKYAYLGSIDHLWMDHIDHIDDLREGVELRAYGQRDPLVEFKNEAYSLFENLVIRINEELSRRLFRIGIGVPQPEIPLSQARENIDKSDMTGVVEPKKKIGRNDPCPCGSGKKYKHCHYPQYG